MQIDPMYPNEQIRKLIKDLKLWTVALVQAEKQIEEIGHGLEESLVGRKSEEPLRLLFKINEDLTFLSNNNEGLNRLLDLLVELAHMLEKFNEAID